MLLHGIAISFRSTHASCFVSGCLVSVTLVTLSLLKALHLVDGVTSWSPGRNLINQDRE